MITIRKRDLDRIFEHGRDGYPHEVCGIIMGTYGEASKRVEEIRIAGNLNTERAHDRYEMDPKDILKAEREGAGKGLEIVGFYHTHPDHPDEPSEFDRERSWPSYSYIIVSVNDGSDFKVRSWILNEDTKRFEEEKIEILGEGE